MRRLFSLCLLLLMTCVTIGYAEVKTVLRGPIENYVYHTFHVAKIESVYWANEVQPLVTLADGSIWLFTPSGSNSDVWKWEIGDRVTVQRSPGHCYALQNEEGRGRGLFVANYRITRDYWIEDWKGE